MHDCSGITANLKLSRGMSVDCLVNGLSSLFTHRLDVAVLFEPLCMTLWMEASKSLDSTRVGEWRGPNIRMNPSSRSASKRVLDEM